MAYRKVTGEERQVLLEHPELVMFDVKESGRKEAVTTIAVFSIPAWLCIILPMLLLVSPFGQAHPTLSIALSFLIMLVVFCTFIPLYMHFENRRFDKEAESNYIKLLKKSLPKELECKVVMIKWIVYQKMEGAYIEDGEEKFLSYVGNKNIFRLIPDTEVAIVSDNETFWAFIKRDAVTESFYCKTGEDK